MQACVSGRKDHRNPLHWAARNGQLDIVKWLHADHGVDLDSPTSDGTTSFHWATWQGHFCTARWLRDAGCDFRARNKYGCNSVHWAGLTGNLPMCRWLLLIGLDVTVGNKQGHTALHKAAYKGHAEVCKWLVQVARIDARLLDEGGYTAGAVAAEQGNLALAGFLDQEAHGAAQRPKPSADHLVHYDLGSHVKTPAEQTSEQIQQTTPEPRLEAPESKVAAIVPETAVEQNEQEDSFQDAEDGQLLDSTQWQLVVAGATCVALGIITYWRYKR